MFMMIPVLELECDKKSPHCMRQTAINRFEWEKKGKKGVMHPSHMYKKNVIFLMNWYQFYFFFRLYCVPAKCMCNSKSESLKSAQSHIDGKNTHTGKKNPPNIETFKKFQCISALECRSKKRFIKFYLGIFCLLLT